MLCEITCYGVKCVVSRTLGPTEEAKKQAKELYEKLVEYDVGFFNVISGDYDKSEHEKYTL